MEPWNPPEEPSLLLPPSNSKFYGLFWTQGLHIMDSRRLLWYSNKVSGVASYINLLVFLMSGMKFVKSNPFPTPLLGNTASCTWAHCVACNTRALTLSCATEWLKKNKREKCRSRISPNMTNSHPLLSCWGLSIVVTWHPRICIILVCKEWIIRHGQAMPTLIWRPTMLQKWRKLFMQGYWSIPALAVQFNRSVSTMHKIM